MRAWNTWLIFSHLIKPAIKLSWLNAISVNIFESYVSLTKFNYMKIVPGEVIILLSYLLSINLYIIKIVYSNYVYFRLLGLKKMYAYCITSSRMQPGTIWKRMYTQMLWKLFKQWSLSSHWWSLHWWLYQWIHRKIMLQR